MSDPPVPEEEGPPPSGAAQDGGKPAASVDPEKQNDQNLSELMPVVGLGGSAGCLSTLQAIFTALPDDTGMAFVVIVHLAPTHESALPQILQRCTKMPVVEAREGVALEADHVYTIPAGKYLTLVHNQLALAGLAKPSPRAVDLFFKSLADARGSGAIAIVLSGSGADGSAGIRRIKEQGGLTIAQDPADAEFGDMPAAALETGAVDLVLPSAKIAAQLVTFGQNARRLRLPGERDPEPLSSSQAQEDESALRDILSYLRQCTNRGFSDYKRTTVLRRIGRRMQVNGLAQLADYRDFLRSHSDEPPKLLADLLITVTQFFRDPEAFAAIEGILPRLFAGKKRDDEVRVWVAGCATGEEAYSLAILLLEYASTLDHSPAIQVIATDISERAIETARAGLFPESIVADMSETRLRRFFVPGHDRYRVQDSVRRIVLFAVHDMLKDPPFSRLDLLTCRNLLIYLNREAQRHAFTLFHYSLRADGWLMLGLSETMDDSNRLFNVADKLHNIFQPSEVAPLRPPPASPPARIQSARKEEPTRARNGSPGICSPGWLLPDEEVRSPTTWGEIFHRLIERTAPPAVVINRDGQIVYLTRSANRFLERGGGEPTHDFLTLVHPALRLELRAALFRADQTESRVERKGLPVEFADGPRRVDIAVQKTEDVAPGVRIIYFSEHPAGDAGAADLVAPPDADVLHSLELELELVKQQLRGTLEQYGASAEESTATTEELQSMNEELRSTTEELETSREELQSSNEELATVNDELQSKVEELSHSANDLRNLMTSTEVATVFLDRELRIQSFTKAAIDLFNLIPADVGRPLSNLTPRVDYPALSEDARRVLDHLTPVEREVGGPERCLLARALPYRTGEDKIGGVVFTFLDITERKASEIATAESEARFRALVEHAAAGICCCDNDGRIVFANAKLAELWGGEVAKLMGLPFWDLIHSADRDMTRGLLERLTGGHESLQVETRIGRSDEKAIWTNFSISKIRNPAGGQPQVVAVLIDISLAKRAETLYESEEQFRRAIEDAPIPVVMYSQESEILQLSRSWTELTGYTLEDKWTFDTWLDQAYGEGAQNLRTHMHELFNGARRVLDVEFGILTRGGSRRVWSFSASSPGMLRDGRRFVVGMAVDITDRKVAEQLLGDERKSLEDLHDLTTRVMATGDQQVALDDILGSAVAMQGADMGTMQLFEPGDSRLRVVSSIGLSEDFIHRHYESAVGPDSVAGHVVRTGRQVTVKDFSTEARFAAEQANAVSWGYRSLQATPLHMRNGRLLGVLTTYFRSPQTFSAQKLRLVDLYVRKAVDLIELKRVYVALREGEERLRVSNDRLAEALATAESLGRAKDQFLATLSHELRTPLNPVLMVASQAATDASLPEPVREQFEEIRKLVELEARLIDDLLDLTQIAGGKISLRRRKLDFHEVLCDAIAITAADAVAKDIGLVTNLAATHSWVIGDAVRLQQLCWNVVRNAVKFSPKHGEVLIQSADADDGGAIEIRISDAGIGMTAQEIGRIFEPFAQGDHASTTASGKFGGMGLGLTICRKVAELHHGEINVTSPGLNRGSTFTIRLPVTKPPVRRSRAPVKSPPDQERIVWKVLVVEDHGPTSQALVVMLGRQGHTVTAVATVAAAILKAAETKFEVLISDLGLPDGNGVDLMKRLRETQPGLIGIALSGYGRKSDIKRSAEAGFSEHLTKPISVEELNAALTRITRPESQDPWQRRNRPR